MIFSVLNLGRCKEITNSLMMRLTIPLKKIKKENCTVGVHIFQTSEKIG